VYIFFIPEYSEQALQGDHAGSPLPLLPVYTEQFLQKSYHSFENIVFFVDIFFEILKRGIFEQKHVSAPCGIVFCLFVVCDAIGHSLFHLMFFADQSAVFMRTYIRRESFVYVFFVLDDHRFCKVQSALVLPVGPKNVVFVFDVGTHGDGEINSIDLDINLNIWSCLFLFNFRAVFVIGIKLLGQKYVVQPSTPDI